MEKYWTRLTHCALTIILLCSNVVYSSSSVTPATVSDTYNNSANSDSNITWASVPDGATYPGETPYDDAGLGALYGMAVGFINIVGSAPLPYDAIASVMSGGAFDISSFISYGIGWGICIGIGILFILIMPIVACCFCCCRCCGNCGGKMEHKGATDSDAGCRKITYSVLLFVCTTFQMIAIICVYVTNDKISASIGSTVTSINNSMTTVSLYMTNTVDQINYVAIKDFEFARKVINRDLDNIGVIVGIPVRTTIGTTGNVDNAINSIIALDTSIQDLATKLIAVNTSVAVFKVKGNQLISELNDTATNITNTLSDCGAPCNSVDPSQLQMSADLDQLPDISSQVSQIDSVQSNNITALALDGKKQFDDIPDRVTNETLTTVASIKNMLANFTTTINSSLSSITAMTGMFTNLSSSLAPVYSGIDQAKSYDAYRNYGGLGLACLLLIIVVLQFLGLVFGICGHSKEAKPTERGCISNCGGLLLMAAVGLSFIFSVFLMLFVVIMFPLGGLLEKAVCQPLTDDPTYAALGKLIDNNDSLVSTMMLGAQGGYVLGSFLGNASIPLTLSGVLTDCKANKAAYSSLKLNNMFDIASVTNYRAQIDITTQLDSLTVDLSTVTILSSNTETQLTDFRDSLNIDFSGFLQQTNQSVTQVDLSAFANELRNLSANLIAANASFATIATELNSSADSLDTIQTSTVPDVSSAQSDITTNIASLSAAAPGAQTTVNTTLDNTRTAQTYIQTNGSDVVVDEAKIYANRILGVADQFVTRALDAINNDVGKCGPVYTIFKTIFNTILCGNVVDTLNGFWFTLGWYVFFMIPSIIFAVKLAKHFRTMTYETVYDDARSETPDSMKKGPPSFGKRFSHKVSPS